MPTTATPAQGAPVDGPTQETTMKTKKNALFMALVTGLAQEARRKQEQVHKAADEPEPAVEEREPTQVSTANTESVSTHRDAIPTLTSANPVQSNDSVTNSENAVPVPPPPPQRTMPSPPRTLRTPSPGQYHKLLSINKLGKEEPKGQHQIHAKAFREKAYIGPRKIVEAVQESTIEQEHPNINVQCNDAFFAELKHRAALQNVTQSLLENKGLASVAIAPNHKDEISALDSKSFESQRVYSTMPMTTEQPCVVVVQPPGDLPVKYWEVLPDDEKKDIVMENKKEEKVPLPFDCSEIGKEEAGKSIEELDKDVDDADEIAETAIDPVQTLVKPVETLAKVQSVEAKVEEAKSDAPSSKSAPVKATVETKSETDEPQESVCSNKSQKANIVDGDDDDVQSFKSLPATFSSKFKSTVSFKRDFKDVLQKYGSKSKGMEAVIENEVAVIKPKIDMQVEEIKEEEQNTLATQKANANEDDYDEVASTAISIKEITISSGSDQDDSSVARSTALATISSKIEHQTRKLAQLEADALRKHKEAETAAIDARLALEKMLDAKSKEKVEATDYTVGYKSSLDGAPQCAADGSKASKVYKDKAKEQRKPGNHKSVVARSIKQNEVSIEKGHRKSEEYKSASRSMRNNDKEDSNFSLCSTWSEDDDASGRVSAPMVKSKVTKDYDYESIRSRSQRGESEIESNSASGSHYSEASGSQYNASFGENSFMNEESDSYVEDESVCDNSTSASTYREDSKVSDIKKKHGRINTHRHQTEYTESHSLGETRKKKGLLLPSLMSPDPPSQQGKASRRVGDSHPRNKPRSKSRSKSSHRMTAEHDVRMSNKSTNKPNHLLSYSSAKSSPKGISPETRQPVLFRHKSAPHEQSNCMMGERQLSYGNNSAAPISLAGYTSRDNAPSFQHNLGVSPQISQQQYKQHYQYTPNNMPSASISLAGYNRPTNYSTTAYGGPTMGIQSSQPASHYPVRPYNSGQMQYQGQQHHVAFANPLSRSRVNQYSMPPGGEML